MDTQGMFLIDNDARARSWSDQVLETVLREVALR